MVDDGNSLDQKLNMSYASVQDDSTIIHISPSATVNQPGRCARAAQVGISSVATTAWGSLVCLVACSAPAQPLLSDTAAEVHVCKHGQHNYVDLLGSSTPGAVLLAAVGTCTNIC